jgi:uncharacterized membrane protein
LTAPEKQPRGAAQRDSHDERIEQVIGRVLQIGVLISAVVVLIGGALLLARYGALPASFQEFRGEDSALKSVAAIIRSALTGDARAITQLGLVLLIATPIGRVALTLGAFAYSRDRLYVLTTSIVLALLLYGLFWGSA